MQSNCAPVMSTEKAYREQLSVAEIITSVLEHVSMYVSSDPRHRKDTTCCMMCQSDVVPKDVNTAVATINTKRTIQHVCGMISNSAAIAEVVSCMNHKFDLRLTKRAFVHWYVDDSRIDHEFDLTYAKSVFGQWYLGEDNDQRGSEPNDGIPALVAEQTDPGPDLEKCLKMSVENAGKNDDYTDFVDATATRRRQRKRRKKVTVMNQRMRRLMKQRTFTLTIHERHCSRTEYCE